MLFYPFTSRVTYDEQGLPLYDRAVDSAFLRDFYKAYWSDGVFYDPTTSFQVTAAGAGMALQVAPGKAQIQGAFAVESEVQSLSVAEADTTNNRIDTVVLRLDLSLDKRSIALAVLGGNDYRLNPLHSTVFIFHRDLTFSVRTEIRQQAALSHFGEFSREFMRKRECHGHIFFRFVRGVTVNR